MHSDIPTHAYIISSYTWSLYRRLPRPMSHSLTSAIRLDGLSACLTRYTYIWCMWIWASAWLYTFLSCPLALCDSVSVWASLCRNEKLQKAYDLKLYSRSLGNGVEHEIGKFYIKYKLNFYVRSVSVIWNVILYSWSLFFFSFQSVTITNISQQYIDLYGSTNIKTKMFYRFFVVKAERIFSKVNNQVPIPKKFLLILKQISLAPPYYEYVSSAVRIDDFRARFMKIYYSLI